MHVRICLWGPHTYRRKQAPPCLASVCLVGRAEPAHTYNDRGECAWTDLFTKQGPAKSVSQCHTAGSIQHTHTQTQKNLWEQLFFLIKVSRFVIPTGQKLQSRNVTQSWIGNMPPVWSNAHPPPLQIQYKGFNAPSSQQSVELIYSFSAAI